MHGIPPAGGPLVFLD